MFRSTVETTATLVLVIGAISIFVPLYLLLLNTAKDCVKENKTQEQNYMVDYDDIRMRFTSEYDRSNPITKDSALKEYFQFMKCKLPFTLAKAKDQMSYTQGMNNLMMVQQMNNQTDAAFMAGQRSMFSGVVGGITGGILGDNMQSGNQMYGEVQPFLNYNEDPNNSVGYMQGGNQMPSMFQQNYGQFQDQSGGMPMQPGMAPGMMPAMDNYNQQGGGGIQMGMLNQNQLAYPQNNQIQQPMNDWNVNNQGPAPGMNGNFAMGMIPNPNMGGFAQPYQYGQPGNQNQMIGLDNPWGPNNGQEYKGNEKSSNQGGKKKNKKSTSNRDEE